MKIIVGIDASRNRSGGAIAHILGILKEIDDIPNDIEEVHIWAYKSLIDLLPIYNWLIKHTPKELEKSLFQQLWWQYKKLPLDAKKHKIDILLNTDAGTICNFHPSVTMSRDMLSYEKGEIERFGFSLARLRLFILRYAQSISLKKADGVIFLTKYAADIIQKYTGVLKRVKIIPHGVSDMFRFKSNDGTWAKNQNRVIKCIYVSIVAFYKHQWNVIKAIKSLREKGYNISITFVGGGVGKAQRIFNKEVLDADPKHEYIEQLDFVKHYEIPYLLKNSDIFIFASSCENMPNTLVEGMASGLPIACSDRGPMPEVLKDAGLYFNPENSISIADALEQIIKDEQLRIDISKKAVKLSEQFTWGNCSKETFQYLVYIYKEATEAGK